MNKLDSSYYKKIYDVKESPIPAGFIDWKSVAIYSSIALCLTGSFAYIIYRSNKELQSRHEQSLKDLQNKHLESKDLTDGFLASIASELKKQREFNQLVLLPKKEDISTDPKTTKHED